MTPTRRRLEAIQRHPSLASAVQMMGVGLLRPMAQESSSWQQMAKQLAESPGFFATEVDSALRLHPGGKHGMAINSDEAWHAAHGACYRMALEHGNTNTNPSLFNVAQRVGQIAERLMLPSRFGIAPVHFLDKAPVADTYPWAYYAPAWSFDDKGVYVADGLAWEYEFSMCLGVDGLARAKVLRQRLIDYCTTIKRIFHRHGGVSQFVDSRTLIMLPGREHEPAAIEVRATYQCAHQLLYAWAITNDYEWVGLAVDMLTALDGVTPDHAIWVRPIQHVGGGWEMEAVGAGDRSNPDTAYKIMPDKGKNVAEGNSPVAQVRRLTEATVPASMRDRSVVEADKAALVAAIEAAEGFKG